jgi:hypothetical protein
MTRFIIKFLGDSDKILYLKNARTLDWVTKVENAKLYRTKAAAASSRSHMTRGMDGVCGIYEVDIKVKIGRIV